MVDVCRQLPQVTSGQQDEPAGVKSGKRPGAERRQRVVHLW